MNTRADPTKLSGIPVVWRSRPLSGEPCVWTIPLGKVLTVAELIAAAPLPDDLRALGEVRVNGCLLPRSAWHLVRPKIGGNVPVGITVSMPFGKSPEARSLASIAILLAATAITGGVAAFGAPVILGGAGAFLTAGSLSAQLAGGLVALGGTLALAALSAPPTADPTQSQQVAQYTIAKGGLAGNTIAPGATVPRVIGSRRITPPLGCYPLREIVGDQEVVEAVYVLSGPTKISDVRFGNVPSTEVDEAIIEIQEGLPNSARQTLVKRRAITQSLAIELSGHKTDKTTQSNLESQSDPDRASPQWHTVVSSNSPDEFWIDANWIEGLFANASPTAALNQALRFRFRKRGDPNWINAPEIHVSANKPGQFQKSFRFKWGTTPSALNLPPSNQGPVYAFKHVPGQGGGVVPATAGWDAASYFSAGAGNDYLGAAVAATTNVRNTELFDDKVIFWLSEATFPKGAYEVQMMRSQAYPNSQFTPSTYVCASGIVGTIVLDFFKYVITSGGYKVANDQGDYHTRVVSDQRASVWLQNPIQSTKYATLSVRVRGRVLADVSVLAEGYTYDWNGSAWNTLTTTSNPAPHYRDTLISSMCADPMPAELIDDAILVAWRANCIARNYRVDAILDGRSGDDAQRLIANAGYATPRRSEKWSVVYDRNRSGDSPVQVFSPANMQSFGFSRGYPKAPDGFRVRFCDADEDYRERTIVVLDPDVAPRGSFRLEEVSYDGYVHEADVVARALFDFKQARYRLAFFQGEVGLDGFVPIKGDLVAVQHDVLTQDAGAARIIDVLTSGGNVTGLVLDRSVPVRTEDAWSNPSAAWSSYSSAWSAGRTGVYIRQLNGAGIVKEVIAANDDAKTLTFVSPFSDPGLAVLAPDCLLVAGRFGQEYSRMIVFDVAPKDDMTATMTFVPEAPELWQ